MTIYRQVHVHMWKDEWFVGLTVHERLLFTYLIRNERAHFSGLFDLPVGVMAFETSIPEDEVRETLAASERQGRICYEAETGKIFVKNLMCYNGGSASNKRVMANLRKQGDDLWETADQAGPATADRVSIPHPRSPMWPAGHPYRNWNWNWNKKRTPTRTRREREWWRGSWRGVLPDEGGTKTSTVLAG